MHHHRVVLTLAAVMASVTWSAVPASATMVVTVTCSVPKSQPERQLASNSCLNYIPDGTQTYVAFVQNLRGHPRSGVTVTWTTSDTADSHFRVKQNPCVTDSTGHCQAELKDMAPYKGEKITVTATIPTGASGTGYLTFM